MLMKLMLNKSGFKMKKYLNNQDLRRNREHKIMRKYCLYTIKVCF